MNNRWSEWRRMIFVALALPLLFLLSNDSLFAATDGAAAANNTAPLCRMGVNVHKDGSLPGIEAFDIAPLRLGWYIDYQADVSPPRPGGIDYAPVIRLEQTGPDSYSTNPSGQALTNAILAHAGKKIEWYVSNEPDRVEYQDDIMPAVYAKAYHELRALIKSLDPTANVIAGSIVQASEIRIQYLDLILAAHQSLYGTPMEVDGWATHGFVLREKKCAFEGDPDCWGAEIPPGVAATEGLVIDVQQNDDFDIFAENIVRMRQWMADNGYRNVPLYLSEYGVLMPAGLFNPDFPPSRVNTFMSRTIDYVVNGAVNSQIGYPPDGNRLVQQLSWYSINDRGGFNGYLFDVNLGNQISPMGLNFAAEAAKIGDDIDFTPINIAAVSPIYVQMEEKRAWVTIGVNVANAGNNFRAQATAVKLYDGDPNGGGKLLTESQARVVGCGNSDTAYFTIPVPWDGQSIGSLPSSIQLFAIVNPDGTVDEVYSGNNTRSATVALKAQPPVSLEPANFLPYVQRLLQP